MKEILYKELFPDRWLSDFVKCFWWAENVTDITHQFTILPDGCFGMIFQYHNNKLQTIFLKGIWTKPFEIDIPTGSTFYAIRFKPLAVETILPFRIDEIVDQNIEMEQSFWDINNLPFKNLQEFSDLLTMQMLSAWDANKKLDERKQKLFQILSETKGSLTVDEITKTVFWSSRQINRYFTQMFGLSLKSYCNILKVYAAYSDIAKGEFYPQQDYYDQAHFIKNVKQYTGANPKKLYQNKNDRFIQLSIIDRI
jgi:AraC-like DNA-binding protein